jgi:GT2 family glycosyltransferase
VNRQAGGDPFVPELSVIIVNWNGQRHLEVCLSALRRQTFGDFETILVDNASTDGSVEFVRERFPEVRVIVLGTNAGFAAGNNAGYERARGEWVVLLNNDTEADERWLEEIHNAGREFPGAGSFASKMLLFDDRKRIDNCGFAVTRAGTAVDLGRDEQDGPAWAKPRKVFGACAGAAAYRRSMLDDIGFLDPEFFMTFEDLDLSFRGQLQGYECVFLPRAIVYHRLGATRKKNPAQDVFFSQRNIELAYLKNMPFRMILGALPHRLVYELGGAAYFTKLGVGTAFFKAKLDAVRRLRSVLRKRRELQRRRILTHEQLRAMLLRYRLWSKWGKFSSAWRLTSGAAARHGAVS